jgi:hypothetical protein
MNGLILRASGRLVDPVVARREQLAELETERGRAEQSGDRDLVVDVDRRMDELFAETREQVRAERPDR